MSEEGAIKTIGVCPECFEVITGNQPWEMVDGKPMHSRCKLSREETERKDTSDS
jgi:hypothetical protein